MKGLDPPEDPRTQTSALAIDRCRDWHSAIGHEAVLQPGGIRDEQSPGTCFWLGLIGLCQARLNFVPSVPSVLFSHISPPDFEMHRMPAAFQTLGTSFQLGILFGGSCSEATVRAFLAGLLTCFLTFARDSCLWGALFRLISIESKRKTTFIWIQYVDTTPYFNVMTWCSQLFWVEMQGSLQLQHKRRNNRCLRGG